MSTKQLRVALVHEWFVTYAGSERVVEQILKIFPQADLFSVVDFMSDEDRKFLGGRKAKTSFIQHLPKARTSFRNYLPLMPLAVEQFDLSGYDLIISSSHAVAKGVITGPGQVHVSYVHSPMRYAWDLQHQYLNESKLTRGLKAWIARASLHYLRLWDHRTAHGVDSFMANSAYIARRIEKVYGRRSAVVYPPVDVERFALRQDKSDFYVTASRMVPYKRMPLIAEAFARMPDRKLVILGDGPDMGRIREIADQTSNVQVLGHRPSAVLVEMMSTARAFVFAAEEDFGITPVESQACGTPVIAFGRGGACETVNTGRGPDRTGLLFAEQSVESICEAVERFEQSEPIDPMACRRNAERFSEAAFKEHFLGAVADALADTHYATTFNDPKQWILRTETPQ